MDRRKKLILMISGLLVLAVALEYIALGAIARVKRENRVQEAYIYGQSVVDSIQIRLDNAVEVTKTLKYPYIDNNEFFLENFDKTIRDIAEEHPSVECMFIAPKGVIQYAYPTEIKDMTIGFRMFEDPEQSEKAKLAVETREITVAGPHKLIEGGQGFIIRNPIFVDDQFVGFTIIVLDLDKFMEEVKSTSQFKSDEFDFALMKKEFDAHVTVDEYGYIFNSSNHEIDDKIGIEFVVPNDIWVLYVEPVDGWRVYKDMCWQIVMSVFIALLLIAFLIFIFETQEKSKLLYKEVLASEAKSSFLARMSHDIRTPLNGIIGLMQISEMHPDDFELISANRKKAMVAAEHLLSLISDVLELQKMEEKNVVLVKEPFNFIDLATDVLTITSVRAAESGINLIHKDCASQIEFPYIYGSPLHVRQILLNIIGNAIKYNRPGGSVTCEARTDYYDGENVMIKMTISDTGIGMSQEFMERMFDPFSQEHSDARSTYQGTGLGMAIVKSLVDKMNGIINVESIQGEGTTFVVTLPFKVATKEEVEAKQVKINFDLEGVKILLVEDNELNREIAEAILKEFGAVVTCATNGEEAVEQFTKNKPGTFDVILMDLMMPVLDGYGATDQIRKSDKIDAASIPIIAMTANAFSEDVQKCLDSGMNAHLAKPIDVNKLLSLLAEIMY